ncbi:M48 family metalloprotease [Nitrosovibrio tenuis]|uniref:Putative Zn-dependent protease, contains TPR repeats n=1 Tax=Nitrosovibrio tenuis TaxID=1233 RepID=A0A1H7FW13_9PROT|nr:M48 family metalloprotease [Nitrosovibrio tenuis]SEK29457.1 Putative Zn-dependent protease, contains TPR repeats [Nitrosovibrio tenuis]
MKVHQILAVLPLLFALPVFADELPDLGDVSQATISPRQERELGLQIMSEIRADPSYLDDAEIAGYLATLGNKLILGSREARPDQEFEFFTVKDSAINAFALPGGFMGFNTGLILAAQSESELAGVMAHEIAHVTQKHLARMISGQKYSMLTSLAAVALAVLASRTNPQAGAAVLVASQARQIQSQLDFTRDHEKEADRIGMNILVGAGFDPHGMAAFFEHLQKAGRFQENGAPSYLRTHPITYERIADIENRIQSTPYRQVPDSMDFQLVRAKVRPYLEKAGDAVKYFESVLGDKRYINEAVERYGLVNALLQDRKYLRADKELARLYEALQPGGTNDTLENHRLGSAIRIERKTSPSSPMVETLAARVKLAVGQTAEALDIYQAALKIFPQHRALVYDYTDALLRSGRADTALKFVSQQLQFTPNDTRLYVLQAQSHEALGDNMSQHRAQAEVYARQGDFPAAVEQLQIALRTSNGDFYQTSSVEARLKELRELAANKKAKTK